jgi:hypothetical protein
MSNSIARDDIAATALHARCCGRAPARRRNGSAGAASPQRRVSSSSRGRRSDAHTADPIEWLAQAPVGVRDQERNAERTTPRPPFGDNVGACRRHGKG